MRKMLHVRDMLTQVSLKVALGNSGHLENSATDSVCSLKLTLFSPNGDSLLLKMVPVSCWAGRGGQGPDDCLKRVFFDTSSEEGANSPSL